MLTRNSYISFLVALPLLLLSLTAYPQGSGKTKRKAKRAFSDAKFDRSAELYGKLAENLPVNFDYNFRAGVSWFYSVNLANRVKALPYLEAAAKVNMPDTIPELYYYLGQTYHLVNRFDDAIAAYSRLHHYIETLSGDTVDLDEISHYIATCRNAKELIGKPVNVNIVNLGAKVNSPFPDYAATMPADESVLVFTSRREGSTGGKQEDDDMPFEDIYISKKINGEWSEAVNAGTELNTKKHDASVAISPDGKQLYIYRSSDIWVSARNGENWNEPVKLRPDVTSKSYEPSVSLSIDENTIYFVSERAGGYGGKDIYRSVKQADGTWSKGENLGPSVNTRYDEDSPYVSSKGDTLFFASKGHNSMGGYDVFSSSFTSGKWSQPVNLGYPINSPWNDIFYMKVDKDRAYYSTIRSDSHGDYDIYMITPRQKTLQMIVQSESKEGGETRFDMRPNPKLPVNRSNPKFNVIDSLVPGQTYQLTVGAMSYKDKTIALHMPSEAAGSMYVESYFEPLTDAAGKITAQKTSVYAALFDIDSEIAKDPELSKIADKQEAYSKLVRKIDTASTTLNFKVYTFIDKADPALAGANGQGTNGAGMRFNPVLFDFEQAALNEGSEELLGQVHQYLVANPGTRLEIHGHTDQKGSDPYNLDLSKRRANAVAAWLKSKGISTSRITIIAHGKSNPVVQEFTPADSEQNRRVELIAVPAK